MKVSELIAIFDSDGGPSREHVTIEMSVLAHDEQQDGSVAVVAKSDGSQVGISDESDNLDHKLDKSRVGISDESDNLDHKLDKSRVGISDESDNLDHKLDKSRVGISDESDNLDHKLDKSRVGISDESDNLDHKLDKSRVGISDESDNLDHKLDKSRVGISDESDNLDHKLDKSRVGISDESDNLDHKLDKSRVGISDESDNVVPREALRAQLPTWVVHLIFFLIALPTITGLIYSSGLVSQTINTNLNKTTIHLVSEGVVAVTVTTLASKSATVYATEVGWISLLLFNNILLRVIIIICLHSFADLVQIVLVIYLFTIDDLFLMMIFDIWTKGNSTPIIFASMVLSCIAYFVFAPILGANIETLYWIGIFSFGICVPLLIILVLYCCYSDELKGSWNMIETEIAEKQLKKAKDHRESVTDEIITVHYQRVYPPANESNGNSIFYV